MKEKKDKITKSNKLMPASKNQPAAIHQKLQVVESFIEFGKSCPYLMAELDYYLERVGTKVDYENIKCKEKKGIFVSEIIKKEDDVHTMVQRLNGVYPDPNKKLFTVAKSSTGQGFRIQVSFHRIEDYAKVNEKIFEKVLTELNRSFSFKINDDVFNPAQITEVDWKSDQTFPDKLPIFFGIRGQSYGGKSIEFVQKTLAASCVDKGYCLQVTDQIPKLFNDNLKLQGEGHKVDEYYLEPKASVKIVYRFNSRPAQLKSNSGLKGFQKEVGSQIIQGITSIDKDTSLSLVQNYLSTEDIGHLSQLNKATWVIENSFFKKEVASSKNEQESSNNSTLKKG
jgi:hypothetical protein